MKVKKFLGWPVMTADNCFNAIRDLGIKAWPPCEKPQPLEEWLPHATDRELDAFKRFSPKSQFVRYADPRSGKPGDYFRSVFKPSAVVFVLIREKYVFATAEWKHGNGKITIVPVAGTPGKEEEHLPALSERMTATAFREWREETGTELESVHLLAPSSGIYSAVRPAELQYFPFFGYMKTPIKKGPTKYDASEHVATMLFPVDQWLRLIEDKDLWDENPEFGLEMCARDITYAALSALGRLVLHDV